MFVVIDQQINRSIGQQNNRMLDCQLDRSLDHQCVMNLYFNSSCFLKVGEKEKEKEKMEFTAWKVYHGDTKTQSF